MRAVNWQTLSLERGLVYFPAGTYYVSAPIDFSAPDRGDPGPFVCFAGEMGRSIVVGDFAEYVFKRGILASSRWTGNHGIEGLTIINRHAGGGGIRLGASQQVFIRDCDITADIAINDDNTDLPIPGEGGNLNGSFEVIIENCNCRPYNTLATGTAGCYKLSDGPVKNCTFTGFDLGMGTASGQGAATIYGCLFERNNTGFAAGTAFESNGGGSNFVMSGCRFKDNGIAINKGGGGANFQGILIEATTGSISGNPQYGIKTDTGSLSGMFQGVTVRGDYQQYGVYVAGGESSTKLAILKGVKASNSTGLGAWHLSTSAMTALYKDCNVAPVFTVAELPSVLANITSTSWAAGTATINFSSPVDVSPLATKPGIFNVAGVSPSGYNGFFDNGTFVNFAQVTYPLASDPGGSGGAAGTIFLTGADSGGNVNAFEGHTYNISDANTSTWGAAVAGGGSNHVKVRQARSAWTVVGK